MQNSSSAVQKRAKNFIEQNPIEAIGDMTKTVAESSVQTAIDLTAGIGNGLLETFLNKNAAEQAQHKPLEQTAVNYRKGEYKTLFNFQQEQEIRAIKELTKRIQEEVQALKKASAAMESEIKDIEKLSINSLPEKPGVYHVHFLEVVLSILKVLHAKINESNTWMQALISKKKKRGSAFAALSKKKGTQYSMSQELSTARSVQ